MLRFAAVGVALLAGGALVVAPADAAPTRPTCSGPTGTSRSDMDIDGDGTTDTVVGLPSATVAGQAGAGAVDIHFGDGRVQRFDESLFSRTPAAGDAFGASVAFSQIAALGGCEGLAIGAPGTDGGRGSATFVSGSDDGVSPIGADTLTGRTPGEHFGSSVVTQFLEDEDVDGPETDIWVSAPDRTVDGVTRAGAVDKYRFNGVFNFLQTLTENTPGIHGLAETGDGFGRTLDISRYGPLLVGEPAEDVGTHAQDAGTVTAVYDSLFSGTLRSSQTFSQNSPGVPGTAEAGDHFGTSISSKDLPSDATKPRLAVSVGAPGEALGRLAGAGTVDRFALQDGVLSNASALSQNSAGVPGSDEAYDRFGKRVLYDDDGLCVAVPGEDLGRAHDTGRVLCHGRQYTTGWETFREGSGTLGGSPRSNAAYGSELARSHYAANDGSGDQEPQYGGEGLLIAVPGADVAGVPASGQLRYADRYAFHDSAGPVANERYGVPAFIPTAGPVQPRG